MAKVIQIAIAEGHILYALDDTGQIWMLVNGRNWFTVPTIPED